ncbi:MAG: bifunctional nuclease family protein [Bacteroidales bacterium]|nr:bifunctional nuclease family protein [Bacteroidales bacterium]
MEYCRIEPYTVQGGMSMIESYVVMVGDIVSMRGVPIRISAASGRALINENLPAESYTLMLNTMKAFELSMQEMRIDSLVDGIYNTTILLSDGFNERRIACRVEDALMMAITVGCKIMIEKSILNESGCDMKAMVDNLPENRAEKDDNNDLDLLVFPDDDPDDETSKEVALIEELEKLYKLLEKYEKEEDYETAAKIQTKIDELNRNRNI